MCVANLWLKFVQIRDNSNHNYDSHFKSLIQAFGAYPASVVISIFCILSSFFVFMNTKVDIGGGIGSVLIMLLTMMLLMHTIRCYDAYVKKLDLHLHRLLIAS